MFDRIFPFCDNELCAYVYVCMCACAFAHSSVYVCECACVWMNEYKCVLIHLQRIETV